MKLGITLTGGGSLTLSDLLTPGGASEYLSFGYIPYSHEALHEFIGKEPNKYGSIETARDMAMYTIQKLEDLHQNEQLTAIGCSAVLAKKDERVGRDNHAFICRIDGCPKTNAIRVVEVGIKFAQELGREVQEYNLASFLTNLIKETPSNYSIFRPSISKSPKYKYRNKLIHLDWYWINE